MKDSNQNNTKKTKANETFSNPYNLPFVSLSNVNDISDIQCSPTHFQYKNIDFCLTKNSKSKRVIVIFHGAIKQDIPKPIFRGYNYAFHDTTVLCICDPLIKIYEQLSIGYYISTEKVNTKSIISEVIDYILHMEKHKNIIFHGSSAGANAAVLFALKYNSSALVTNGYLFVDKHYSFLKYVKNAVDKDNNKIVDNYDIDENIMLIKKGEHYENIFIVNNKNDKSTVLQSELLSNICTEKNISFIKFLTFDETCEGKHSHHIHFPFDYKLKNVLESKLSVYVNIKDACDNDINILQLWKEQLEKLNISELDCNNKLYKSIIQKDNFNLVYYETYNDLINKIKFNVYDVHFIQNNVNIKEMIEYFINCDESLPQIYLNDGDSYDKMLNKVQKQFIMDNFCIVKDLYD